MLNQPGNYGVNYRDATFAPVYDLRELIALDYRARFMCDPGLAWWIPQEQRPREVMDLRSVVLDTGTISGLRKTINTVAASCPFVLTAVVSRLFREGDKLICVLDVDPLEGARLRVRLAADGETLEVTTEAIP